MGTSELSATAQYHPASSAVYDQSRLCVKSYEIVTEAELAAAGGKKARRGNYKGNETPWYES